MSGHIFQGSCDFNKKQFYELFDFFLVFLYLMNLFILFNLIIKKR